MIEINQTMLGYLIALAQPNTPPEALKALKRGKFIDEHNNITSKGLGVVQAFLQAQEMLYFREVGE